MANNDHPDLPNGQLHFPKDFEGAGNGYGIEKGNCGILQWVLKMSQQPVSEIVPLDEAPPAIAQRYLVIEGDSTVIHPEWGVDVSANDLVDFNYDADSTLGAWCGIEPEGGLFAWVDTLDVIMIFNGVDWMPMYGGKLFETSVEVANAGAGEEILGSYTLLANTMISNGVSVKIQATLVLAANANGKTIKVKFGTRVYEPNLSSVNNRILTIDVDVIRLAKNSELMIATSNESQYDNTSAAQSHNVDFTTSQDLHGDVEIEITGQGVAASDIIMKNFKVLLNP